MNTENTPISWDGTVLPFQLNRANIRGRAARIDTTLEDMLKQHVYPAVVTNMVAQAALLTVLIGQTMKLRWKLSLQIRGKGPLRLIATDYFGPKEEGGPAEVRAYASYDADELDEGADGFGQIGDGFFAVLIDQGQGMQPYQGITPLTGGSLSSCAETYFAQSEQIPTRFSLMVAEAIAPGQGPAWRAGGVMLQHLPDASPFVANEDSTPEDGLPTANDLVSGDTKKNWSRVNILLDTAEETEMIGPYVTQDQLATRLFHEEGLILYEPQKVQFGCTCGEVKVRQTMSIYSAKDIQTMTNDAGQVTADCQFCGAHYEFAPEALGFEAKLPDE